MGTLFNVDGTTGQARLILHKGTSNPVTGTEGQLFYRTDTDQLEAHDGVDFKAVLGGSFRIWGETPNETPNGVTTVFSVDNPYVTGTTMVTRDGLVMKLGDDYTESAPQSGQITFSTAPATSSIVLIAYSRVEGSALPLMNKFDVVTGTPKQTYTGSTTVYDLPFAYTPGAGSLFVYSAGVLMLVGASNDYLETDNNTITFNTARSASEIVQFVKIGAANDQSTSGWIDAGTNVQLQTATDQVQIGAGSPSLPSLAFMSDTNTGLYLSGTDEISYVAGGSTVFRTETNFVRSFKNFIPDVSGTLDIGGTSNAWARILTSDGTAALPAYTFGGDTDTGMFKDAANRLQVSVGGVERVRFGTAQVSTTVPIVSVDGSVSSPAFQGTTSSNTGMYFGNTDRVDFASGGVATLRLRTTYNESMLPFNLPDGTSASPAIRFDADADLGFYRRGVNDMAAVGNSREAAIFTCPGQGGTNSVGVFNINSGTPSSTNTARLTAQTGTGDGDAFLSITANGNAFHLGVDVSDSNNVAFGTTSTVGNNPIFKVGTSGTASLQMFRDIDANGNDIRNAVSLNDTFLSGFRNRVVNAKMRFDQRNAGTAYTINGSSIRTIDCWTGEGQAADGVFTVTRDSTTPDSSFPFSQLITVTTPDASVGAAQDYDIRHPIEGTHIADFLMGNASPRTFTISFYVRSSITGTYGLGISNAGFTRSYVAQYTINVANTWEYKTITVTGDTTGTWETGLLTGIRLQFDMGSGTNKETTINTWSAGTFTRASGNVRLINTNGATWRITGLQVELGTQATAFEHISTGDDLKRVQRYLTKTPPIDTAAAVGAGQAGAITYAVRSAGGVTQSEYWSYPVTMRATPTLTFFSTTVGGGNNWRNATDGASSGNGGNFANSNSDRGVSVSNAQQAADGIGDILQIHAIASCEL